MTQDEIIALALEAGLLAYDGEVWLSPYQEAMERFANLVAEATKEKAAKVCEEEMGWLDNGGGELCAAAIRSMK